MTNLRGIFLVAVLAGLVAVVAWPRGATADKPPPGCAQWEVMVAPLAGVTLQAKALPEPGKPFVEQSPAGWEPFAFNPKGALVYRRCVK